MMSGIEHVKPGIMFRKFGEYIENSVKKYNFGVVRTYCGHGIGKLLHGAPNVPHYKKNKAVGKLKPGMIFTIEPMINIGNWKDKKWTFDDWTSVTIDGKNSAQFEHTILVTNNGYEILTERNPKNKPIPFWWEKETKQNIERIMKTDNKTGLMPNEINVNDNINGKNKTNTKKACQTKKTNNNKRNSRRRKGRRR